ncbi:MAG: GGDEF domain-containing protein [Acidimicrobiales bacterium]
MAVSRNLSSHEAGTEHQGGPGSPNDEITAARIALGRALTGRASEVGRVCSERLREILRLGPGEVLPYVGTDRTSELATRIIGRYLETGESVRPDEVTELASLGSLAVRVTSTTTLVKVFLSWRDETLLELRDLAGTLGTPLPLLQGAEEVVRASCDASLVRMTKRFDNDRSVLEAMLADEHSRLVHETRHDQLTGLVNRGAFLEIVRQASELHPTSEPIALMFIDLDFFKEINDTHGHGFGDLVLQAVAKRLHELLRPNDIAGRLGGDEFVVLCNGVRGGPTAALVVAQRLCDGLARPLEVDGSSISCPASIGLVCSAGSVDPETLLSKADAALYTAKRNGRARVALG